jgi:major membrane immunogen (membrane-anchored lipoprotein)
MRTSEDCRNQCLSENPAGKRIFRHIQQGNDHTSKKMKKAGNYIIVAIIVVLTLAFIPRGKRYKSEFGIATQDTLVKYIDGTYLGQSRASYTDEPYWGIVSIVIEKGIITGVDFIVRDSAVHETFNTGYEKYFDGNALYLQQFRNDWKGIQTYPSMLKEKKDLKKIDCITGATWSCNVFKAAAEEALKKARK